MPNRWPMLAVALGPLGRPPGKVKKGSHFAGACLNNTPRCAGYVAFVSAVMLVFGRYYLVLYNSGSKGIEIC